MIHVSKYSSECFVRLFFSDVAFVGCVVHREPRVTTYVAPRREPAVSAGRTDNLNAFASEALSTPSQRENSVDLDERPNSLIVDYDDPFADPPVRDRRDDIMPGLEETPHGIPPRDLDTFMSPPLGARPSTPNPLTGSHEYDFPPITASLTTQESNALFQPTFEEMEEDITDTPAQQTLLLPDASYPEYIHDMLAYTSDLPPARVTFYPLWNCVLEYWFPSTQGFKVVQDWDPKTSFQAHRIISPQQQESGLENEGLPPTPKVSFAVFDATSPTEPFLFVHIHNALPVNDFTRRQARVTMEETFETLRACSFCAGYKALCVVSAVGARWGMVVREPGWLEDEGGNGGNGDCIGEWEEDVVGPDSYRVMGYCFEEMKRDVSRRRGDWMR